MQTLRLLAGAACVYVIVAACGSEPFQSSSLDVADAGGWQRDAATHAGGSVGLGADSGGTAVAPRDGGIIDTIGDAVADARHALDAAINSIDSGQMRDALTDPVPDALAAGYESGSRLRLRFLGGSDGSKQFAGWYDSQLETNCTVDVAADGVKRCLPGNATFLAATFLDAGCLQRVVAFPSSYCGTETHARLPASIATGCPSSGYGVAEIGDEITEPTVVYTGTPSSCSETSSSSVCFGATCKWFTVGPQVVPSQFVEMTEQVE